MENQIVVLVAEDDQLVQSVVEDCLSDGGFEAVIASSGDNAVELLDASERKYHALVTDINLSPSKFDGWMSPDTPAKSTPTFPLFHGSAVQRPSVRYSPAMIAIKTIP